MKTFFKFLLLWVSLTLLTVLLSVVLPYSVVFQEANMHYLFPKNVVYLTVNCFWISLTIVFFARKSPKTKVQTALALSLSLFFIYAVISQTEVVIFNKLFVLLSRKDMVWIIVNRGVPVVLIIILSVILLQNEYNYAKYLRPIRSMAFADWIIKPILTGIGYVAVYFVFNYYVAERTEAVRLFYTGKSEYPEFITRLTEYWNTTPSLFGILFIKGLLFGIFILPIVNMFRRKSTQMFTAILLAYETTAAAWLIPSGFFPDAVRIGHLEEAILSMFAFAFITWILFDKIKLSRSSE